MDKRSRKLELTVNKSIYVIKLITKFDIKRKSDDDVCNDMTSESKSTSKCFDDELKNEETNPVDANLKFSNADNFT